ncbi:hypothetical protein BJ684DRAFT_14503 [Piptocephalis cylindrospora]|uniref:Yeast cell wall synthesis Kre9/Knh1-like N-terminal domain-containing protein n=1 Tax=Piptocephalis cylindrospora TaxID=1907219 RepID=A0A4P9Y7V6_9FUNG|nr:hypothetical protein BJ684DRAFT_14503 [Piptocephalis cylindrospora]|eukprot:RKP15236.1 hypothetical protein BJ684DRAFT_14503 [Piptocephalis cylindrospora]
MTFLDQSMADFTITEPIDQTKWTPGSRVTVKWVGSGAGLDSQASWPIELMAGNANALSNIGQVGTAKESDGSFSFVVPKDMPPGNTYTVRMGERYSHQFAVDPSGSTPSPTPTTSKINGTTAAANGTLPRLNSTIQANGTNGTTSNPTATNSLPTPSKAPAPSPGTLPLNPNVGMSGAIGLDLEHASSYALTAPLFALTYLTLM